MTTGKTGAIACLLALGPVLCSVFHTESLLATGEASSSAAPRETRKPAPLVPGDWIGLVAPASPLDVRFVEAAAANLRQRGYRVKLAEGIDNKLGYLAGSDADRARALNRFLADREVKAIICLRGGYGSPRLLDLLDYEAMRKQPKILVGYSDISALLIALKQRTGVVVFHGPMGKEWSRRQGLTPFSEAHYWPVFSPRSALFENWGGKRAGGMKPPLRIAEGVAEGHLTGGNLSVICSTMGTPLRDRHSRCHPFPRGSEREALSNRSHAQPASSRRQAAPTERSPSGSLYGLRGARQGGVTPRGLRRLLGFPGRSGSCRFPCRPSAGPGNATPGGASAPERQPGYARHPGISGSRSAASRRRLRSQD